MKKDEKNMYVCPVSGKKMELVIDKETGDEVLEGRFVSPDHHVFPIIDGVPDFTWPQELSGGDLEMRAAYDKVADEYEKFADHPFRTYEDGSEHDLRMKMLGMLSLNEGDCVLEIGCGSGRGSEYIANKIGSKGRLYMQELSGAFLKKAIENVSKTPARKEYAIANASYLSFKDNQFDAAHHFGGINTFTEVQRCLQEMVRVVKPGGKIVVGDEGMGPWLKETEYGKIMMNSNPLLKYNVPFDLIPVEARDVSVHWVLKGAFFILEFTVGEGIPQVNYHIPIPSERGGTYWTRYFGNLEGVTPETKALAQKARAKLGLSMHEWLDQLVKAEAERILKD